MIDDTLGFWYCSCCSESTRAASASVYRKTKHSSGLLHDSKPGTVEWRCGEVKATCSSGLVRFYRPLGQRMINQCSVLRRPRLEPWPSGNSNQSVRMIDRPLKPYRPLRQIEGAFGCCWSSRFSFLMLEDGRGAFGSALSAVLYWCVSSTCTRACVCFRGNESYAETLALKTFLSREIEIHWFGIRSGVNPVSPGVKI